MTHTPVRGVPIEGATEALPTRSPGLPDPWGEATSATPTSEPVLGPGHSPVAGDVAPAHRPAERPASSWVGWDAGLRPEPGYIREPRLPAQPGTRRARGRGVVVAVLAALGFAAVYALAVRTERGQAVDQALMTGSTAEGASSLLGLVSVSALVLACAVLTVVALVQRRPGAAVAAVGIVATSNVLTQVLKDDVLERPFLLAGGLNSLPSGHMTVFTSVAVAALLVLPASLRLLAAVPAGVVLTLAGTALVEQGWHRPSDVVASVLLVLAVAGAAGLVPGVVPPRPRPATSATAATGAVLGIGTLAVLAAAVLAVGAIVLDLTGSMTTVLLIVATVGAALLAAVWMWRPLAGPPRTALPPA